MNGNNSIKKSLSVTGLVMLSFLVPHRAIAALFSQVYVFGDSLSDTGRLYQFTTNNIPPFPFPIPVSPPYAQKLSNGPLWVEYLQQSLGLTPNPVTNFALAGATTGNTNTTFAALPGLQQQVAFFLAGPAADPNALYVVWAGANDYLGEGQADASIPVTNISNAVSALYGKGARKFLVPNLPFLGRLPNTRPNSILDQRTLDHDALLASRLTGLSATLPGSQITPLNVFFLFDDAITNPGKYGFTNVTDPCLPTDPLGVPAGVPCANPDNYLFWDGIHPTTRTHRFIGQLAATALGVPEPSVTLGLVTLGLGAVGLRLGKKREYIRGKSRITRE
jgi:phospholipase/lecithinase/hemolysin